MVTNFSIQQPQAEFSPGLIDEQMHFQADGQTQAFAQKGNQGAQERSSQHRM
jgi:hypothetical protein